MKKGVSILIVLVIIFSGVNFTIATHYCGGRVAATKVSLSGKLASCGMQETEESCPLPGNHLTSHCCDNKLTTIGIVNNYTVPVLVSIQKDNTQNLLYKNYSPVNQSFNIISVSNNLCTNMHHPPWKLLTTEVSPDKICVFLI